MPVGSNNPTGRDIRQARLKRALEGLNAAAVAALADALANGSISEKLTAAKEVLDRNLGKPKQSTAFDVTVTHTSAAHVAALEALAAQARPIIDMDPADKPLLLLDNPLISDKPTVNQGLEPLSGEDSDA